MIQKILGKLWRHTPARLRRFTMRITHARFTVTAGAVIQNEQGQVLLLKHTFRAGSGWGLPGGFLEGGEQPVDGLQERIAALNAFDARRTRHAAPPRDHRPMFIDNDGRVQIETAERSRNRHGPGGVTCDDV